MIIKIPKNLKIYFLNKRNNILLQFINKYGVIKKKISNDINTLKFKTGFLLKNLRNFKNLNNMFIFKIVMNNLMFNLFKIFKDRLILEGVGYKVWKKLNILKFKIGYSNPNYIKIPNGIKVSIYKFKKITISSISLIYLRNFKYCLRRLKIPDPYKKKGIRFYKEVIKLKEGKKSK